MSGQATLGGYEERFEPGRGRSIALSFAVHAVLLAVLTIGVSWESHAPDTVAVELWSPQDMAPAPAPAKPAPEPPKPVAEPAKPEPRLKKPDIAIKEPKKLKLKQATTIKSEVRDKPKAKPKPKAPAKPDPAYQKLMREELAREQETLRAAREETEMRALIASSTASARSKALADYEARIRAKVRGNIVMPPDVQGNPEAIFDVVQLPTGEVLSVHLRKSSGHKGYDIAVERAIWKSSPLPKPKQTELFSRELELTFHPLDR